jgi:hypothetical protein
MQTTNKIQSLTPEQVAAMPEYVNKWASIGLSTRLTDDQKGTAAIIQMYKVAGYKAPKVYWLDSPLAATLMAAGFCSRSSLQKVREKHPQLISRILFSVRDQVLSQVSEQIFAQVANQVNIATRNCGANKTLDCIRAQILSQAIIDEVDILGRSYWYEVLPGSLNTAHICAAYDFYANAMHLDIGYEKLAPIIGVAEEASIVYTFSDRVFASRKMSKCSLDEQGRPHCEGGPAVLFHDGFSVYARHGEVLFRKEW